MVILLCAATQLEIAPTLSWLDTQNKHQIEWFITGVGLLPTTYSLTKALNKKKWDLVIQAGIAGSLTERFPPGVVTLVSTECMGDIGVVENENFLSIFDMHLADANTWPFQEGKLLNPNTTMVQTGLPLAHSVSVNEISTHPQRINYYRQQLGADIEAMEGAALHYVCLLEGLPFLQLRAVSNRVGEREKKNWKMKEAIDNLNEQLIKILSNLEQL